MVVIKGKTVQTKPQHVKVDTESVIKERYNFVLSVDIMHFTGLNFLIMASRNIRFITATMLRDRKKRTIVNALRQVINIYKGKGHSVTAEVDFWDTEDVKEGTPIHTTLADNEFEALREDMEAHGIKINVTAKEEHVPEVKRQNRVIKEQARAIVQTLPYKSIPKRMRIALIHYVVFWLNNITKAG